MKFLDLFDLEALREVEGAYLGSLGGNVELNVWIPPNEKLGTQWSKYMAQSPKGRLKHGLYKPRHGNCAIYLYLRVISSTSSSSIRKSGSLTRHPLRGGLLVFHLGHFRFFDPGFLGRVSENTGNLENDEVIHLSEIAVTQKGDHCITFFAAPRSSDPAPAGAFLFFFVFQRTFEEQRRGKERDAEFFFFFRKGHVTSLFL